MNSVPVSNTTAASNQIMIVAGEASADMHGASLVAALKKHQADLRICGVGGPALAEQGVEILVEAGKLAVVGLIEVFGHLGDIRGALRSLENRLKEERPRLLILIDFPDFNLILAKKAKKLGIPIFYYITPQVWAWRSGRVKTIGRLTDRVGVILPFEQEFFKKRGVPVDFVGHPLLDTVKTTRDKRETFDVLGYEKKSRLVALLPGSRRKELEFMLPVFLESARELKKDDPTLNFIFPLASTLDRQNVENALLGYEDLNIRIIDTNRYDAMAACDVALAASGTVTLELAILGVPMVVAYRVTPFTYWIGSKLVNLDHYSLVNLVAGEEVVPELIQEAATPTLIKKAIDTILKNDSHRQKMRGKLAEVHARLGSPGAAERAAKIALEAAGLSG